jgi:hypothetical protein
MVLALRMLQVDGEHIYSAEDASYYRFIAGSGLFLLFLAFLLFLVASIFLSRKLSAVNAMFVGCLVLAAAAVTWKIVMFSGVSIHSWTIMLLVPPLICFVSGSLLLVVGGIRFFIKKVRQQTG